MIAVKPSGVSCNEEVVRRFEERNRLVLPKDYHEFLQTYNGGRPESNIVVLTGREIESISIDSFFGFGVTSINNVEDQYRSFQDRIPQGCVPIARTEGGNIVYINLLPKTYGFVYLWDHDTELLLEPDSSIFIATSFEEFLDKVTPYNEDDADLSGYKVLEVWVHPDLKKILDQSEE